MTVLYSTSTRVVHRGGVYTHSPYGPKVLPEAYSISSPPSQATTPRTDSSASASAASPFFYAGVSLGVSPPNNSCNRDAVMNADRSAASTTSTGTANPKSDAVANHYKTRMCKTWVRTGACSYESYCRFAHGEEEMRSYVQNQRAGLTTEDAVVNYQKRRSGPRAGSAVSMSMMYL